jgi:UDP-N-acetyl-D-galactosamine dehydrogenase
VVIYESTVYPGCTEDDLRADPRAGLRPDFNRDFFAATAPSASTRATRPAPPHHHPQGHLRLHPGSRPPFRRQPALPARDHHRRHPPALASIRVAEAAKVIENTQRDLNIALINELA